MATIISISIADAVVEMIEVLMKKNKKSNRSEFIEELIRVGLAKAASDSEKKGDTDEIGRYKEHKTDS